MAWRIRKLAAKSEDLSWIFKNPCSHLMYMYTYTQILKTNFIAHEILNVTSGWDLGPAHTELVFRKLKLHRAPAG